MEGNPLLATQMVNAPLRIHGCVALEVNLDENRCV